MLHSHERQTCLVTGADVSRQRHLARVLIAGITCIMRYDLWSVHHLAR